MFISKLKIVILYVICIYHSFTASTSYFYTHVLETTSSLTSSNFRFIFKYFICSIRIQDTFSTNTLETTLSHIEKLYSLTIK